MGLPNTMGRKKTTILGYLTDRMTKRSLGWEGKLLSRVGKEVLLKTIEQALLNYAVNVFLLPKDTCKQFKGLMEKVGGEPKLHLAEYNGSLIAIVAGVHKTGWYSVKSANKYLQDLRVGWSKDNAIGFWRMLWNLKIPPKVSNFMWRVVTGTVAQLYKRRTSESSLSIISGVVVGSWFERPYGRVKEVFNKGRQGVVLREIGQIVDIKEAF
uniref:Reverse transcriptase zinc-binding domain-containing protein n=1 Tax=Cannabis sativa TaxID=3483 RepID=A0A803Q8J0_CANSA